MLNRSNSSDVVVVGAGVTGSAAAIALRAAGCRVVLIHRTDDVEGVETLSPAAVADLGRLSIIIGCPLGELVAWWRSPSAIRVRQPYARVVARTQLARIVRQRAIDNGASLIEHDGDLTFGRHHGGWRVRFRNATSEAMRTAFIIDATGRAAVVGRHLGARRHNYDALVALSVSFGSTQGAGTWTESTARGWWNLTATTEEHTLSHFAHPSRMRGASAVSLGLDSTRHIRQLVSEMPPKSPTMRPAGSSLLVPCAGPRWFAIGDAASTLQPLSSAGIAKGLRDARVLPEYLQRSGEYVACQTAGFRRYLNLLAHQQLQDR